MKFSLKQKNKRALIIPALNEEDSICQAVKGVPDGLFQYIVVIDNGSSDSTAKKASQSGAWVIFEPHKGYGSACWKGIEALPDNVETVVFMDADLSDDPKDARCLVETLEKGGYDMVIGSRVTGKSDPGALEPWQRAGNWLATFIIKLIWRVHYTDLGPFRAIQLKSLRKLEMIDRGYGWTVEMQIKAAQLGLRICEIPVHYQVRAHGSSKISGNIVGSLMAGYAIFRTLFTCLFVKKRSADQS